MNRSGTSISLSLSPQSALDLRAGWSSPDFSLIWSHELHFEIVQIEKPSPSPWLKELVNEWIWHFPAPLCLIKDMAISSFVLWKWLSYYSWMQPFPRSRQGSKSFPKCVFCFFSLSSTSFQPPSPSVLMAVPAMRTFSMSPALEVSWRWQFLHSLSEGAFYVCFFLLQNLLIGFRAIKSGCITGTDWFGHFNPQIVCHRIGSAISQGSYKKSPHWRCRIWSFWPLTWKNFHQPPFSVCLEDQKL